MLVSWKSKYQTQSTCYFSFCRNLRSTQILWVKLWVQFTRNRTINPMTVPANALWIIGLPGYKVLARADVLVRCQTTAWCVRRTIVCKDITPSVFQNKGYLFRVTQGSHGCSSYPRYYSDLILYFSCRGFSGRLSTRPDWIRGGLPNRLLARTDLVFRKYVIEISKRLPRSWWKVVNGFLYGGAGWGWSWLGNP